MRLSVTNTPKFLASEVVCIGSEYERRFEYNLSQIEKKLNEHIWPEPNKADNHKSRMKNNLEHAATGKGYY